MLQSYQGHFREEVRFYVDNREVMIPTNKRVIINILDDDISSSYAEYVAKLDNTIDEARNGEAYQYFGKEKFSETPKTEYKHISLKERLEGFSGEYEFEEWNTGADVGIEVIK